MPIYAYRCAACGAEKDVLQKFSDAPLSVCPVCAAESFQRVLTAPAFQLKGSGWYATDFRDGNKPKQAEKTASGNGDAASRPDAAGSGSKPDAAKAGAPAKATESPSASSGGAASGPGAD